MSATEQQTRMPGAPCVKVAYWFREEKADGNKIGDNEGNVARQRLAKTRSHQARNAKRPE
jgi:hypothetical protein